MFNFAKKHSKGESNSSDSGNDYDEEDDFITFQYESKQINTYYSHLVKYSRLIRKEYVYSDVRDRLPQELHQFQQIFDISSDNIFLFFQILEKDLTFDNNLILTCKQFTDLFKISDFLQIKKLTKKLKKNFKAHNADVDFIIQIIIQEIQTPNNDQIQQLHFNEEMEKNLSTKINECLQNDQFLTIPIPLIYRIIAKCDIKNISFDLLYNFIKKDLTKNCVLFQFLNLQKLSEEKIKDLYSFYSNTNESQKQCFDYLKCNLDYIKKLNEINQDLSNNLNNQINELKSSLQNTQNERDNLNLYHKAFADRIRCIIPDKSDDERANIIERDTHLSYEVRSIFSSNSDNDILFFIRKDIELSSSIRGIFKSGDDSWIKNQIEEDHIQIKDLKRRINEIENEKNNLQDKFYQIENEKNNLQDKFDKIEYEKNNLQRLIFTDNKVKKIAINGFGHIGRLIFRAIRRLYPREFRVVAIHDLCDIKTNVHLLNYDTSHHEFEERAYISSEYTFEIGEGDNKWVVLNFGGRLGPSELPWHELGINIVIESTGQFRKHAIKKGDRVITDGYDGHLFAGAKRVVLSTLPSDEIECSLVVGVNDEDLRPETKLISAASSTMNCIAPIIKTLNDNFRILTGFVTSIHSYTSDQKINDTIYNDTNVHNKYYYFLLIIFCYKTCFYLLPYTRIYKHVLIYVSLSFLYILVLKSNLIGDLEDYK